MSYPHLLHYHFMQNAYLAGTVVAIAAGAMGYFLVLRGQTFAGHSFANVGFAGATGAALLGIPPVAGLLGGGMLAAVGIHWLGLGIRQTAGVDVVIGAVYTLFLALGYLFIHLSTSEYASGIYNVLFGNVLGTDDTGVRSSFILTVSLLAALAFIGRPLLFASIDPVVAEARGVPVQALSLIFLMLLAVMVAAAVQVVGVLLIFALLVTPAATARLLTGNPAVAIGASIALALVFTWVGLAAGYYTPWPVSFCISTCAFGVYLAARVARSLSRRTANRSTTHQGAAP